MPRKTQKTGPALPPPAEEGFIDVPVLYTVGEFDETMPSTVEEYRRLTPGARTEVFAGGAHLHHLECADRFLGKLRPFLAGLDASRKIS